jgi:hypothetical protein
MNHVVEIEIAIESVGMIDFYDFDCDIDFDCDDLNRQRFP